MAGYEAHGVGAPDPDRYLPGIVGYCPDCDGEMYESGVCLHCLENDDELEG